VPVSPHPCEEVPVAIIAKAVVITATNWDLRSMGFPLVDEEGIAAAPERDVCRSAIGWEKSLRSMAGGLPDIFTGLTE
jgi:hypothetical protein